MSTTRHLRVSELFLAASKLPKEDVSLFLVRECSDDRDLRAEVESLLAHHENLAYSFSKPLVNQSTVATTSDRIVGQTIGPYRITRLIATGGMGSVYEAEQDYPRRSVALKLMKHGIASRTALRRFEFEAQLLARLRHSGIAQVYEAGTHDDGGGGVPYFAMEYIPNAMPITEYATSQKHSTRERIEMFIRVCDAVHHGHQKGIIHRDLKPSNILVDSSGQPKIIDFGVARSTDSDIALTTLQTSVGELIGTLQYMSPEQCVADPNDLDTRSDVYSLGVVLYELLCEQMPYDISRSQIYDATRVIREQPPARPSTSNRKLRGDVETIVLKTLEKERDRRYQSAAELAQDLERYLSNQTIAARPPSMAYQFRTFARRNKAAVCGITAVFIALVVGIIATSWQANVASDERDRAQDAEARAESLLIQEQSARRTSDAVNSFMQTVFASADPREQGQDVTIRDALSHAVEQIEESLHDEPVVEAGVRATIGKLYRSLSEYDNADPQLTAAVSLYMTHRGENDPLTLDTRHELAVLRREQSRQPEAEIILKDVIARRREVFGDRSVAVAVSTEVLGQLAMDGMRPVDASKHFREAFNIRTVVQGPDHPSTLVAGKHLASTLIRQNRFAEAEIEYRPILETQRRVLGSKHMDTLVTMSDLSLALRSQGKLDEAEPLLREAVTGFREQLPRGHYDVLVTTFHLAQLYKQKKEFTLALETFDELIADAEESLAPDHYFWETFRPSKLSCLFEAGLENDAHAYIQSVIELLDSTLGRSHLAALKQRNMMGVICRRNERYAEAEAIYTAALKDSQSSLGDDHEITSNIQTNLATIFRTQESWEEAAQIYADAVARFQANPIRTHGSGLSFRYYGECLLKLNQLAEAEQILLESYSILESVVGVEMQDTIDCAKLLVELYEGQNKPEQVDEWRAKTPTQ